MEKKITKAISFLLAIVMVVAVCPTITLAAETCSHENTVIRTSYEYSHATAAPALHLVIRYRNIFCADCAKYLGLDEAIEYYESHNYGPESGTGENWHSGRFHYYETVKTCYSCKHSEYGSVSYKCNGDGVNCPIIILSAEDEVSK